MDRRAERPFPYGPLFAFAGFLALATYAIKLHAFGLDSRLYLRFLTALCVLVSLMAMRVVRDLITGKL